MQLVGDAFIWTLEQGLGPEWTDDVKTAWTAFDDFVATEMKIGMDYH